MQTPKHIAIIMDGNGRWAKRQQKPRWAGHRAGAKNLENTINTSIKNNIPVLTVFAFGIENWQRPKKEVSYLMKLFLYSLEKYTDFLKNNNIKLKVIGDLTLLPKKHTDLIKKIERESENNNQLILNVAISYSGRWDITNAVKNIFASKRINNISANIVDEQLIAQHLQLSGLPDVDLLIRTSGEKRLSNFLLWQLAYSELYFADEYWPDFNEESFGNALSFYAARKRRFGLTDEQLLREQLKTNT